MVVVDSRSRQLEAAKEWLRAFFLQSPTRSLPWKILVTGSRNWQDEEALFELLSFFPPGTILVHGGAKGADTLAHRYGVGNDFVLRRYPAQWDQHGNAAGPIRNQHMLDTEHTEDSPIDLALGFCLPDSKGTQDMLRRAYEKKIPTFTLSY